MTKNFSPLFLSSLVFVFNVFAMHDDVRFTRIKNGHDVFAMEINFDVGETAFKKAFRGIIRASKEHNISDPTMVKLGRQISGKQFFTWLYEVAKKNFHPRVHRERRIYVFTSLASKKTS